MLADLAKKCGERGVDSATGLSGDVYRDGPRLRANKKCLDLEVAEVIGHCVDMQGGTTKASVLFQAYPCLRQQMDDLRLLEALMDHPEIFFLVYQSANGEVAEVVLNSKAPKRRWKRFPNSTPINRES